MDRQSKSGSKTNERLRDQVWNDIRHGNLKQSIFQEFRDLYEFYVDAKTRDRLDQYGWFRRWFSASWRILKAAILRLTPARRILLLISVFLIFSGGSDVQENPDLTRIQIGVETSGMGYVLLLVVLMLELKDKLLAREELEVGRKVQIALMPEEQPRIPGWDAWLYTRPANDVGGDLVDHLALDETCHGLALGDVSGKGLGAALLMAKLQATIRALAPMRKGLRWLGGELNQIFCRDCMPNTFASLFYLELCGKSGEVKYLNAGHLPPLLLKGFKLSELPQGDPALNLSQKTKFTERSVTLDSSDVLIIFSDGLTEAQNEHGEFYGDNRVQKLVQELRYKTAAEAGRQILDAAGKFMGNARPHDDLSLIILKRWT